MYRAGIKVDRIKNILPLAIVSSRLTSDFFDKFVLFALQIDESPASSGILKVDSVANFDADILIHSSTEAFWASSLVAGL